MTNSTDPNTYVNNNAETLARIVKHSSNTFVRSIALAALVEYGDDPTVDAVVEDLNHLRESNMEE